MFKINVFIVVYIFFLQVFAGKPQPKRNSFMFSFVHSQQRLRPIDRDFLHHLQHKVNIIPVIAKADTLLKSELIALKKQLLSDIDKFGVQLYDFPEGDAEQDEDNHPLDKALKVNERFEFDFKFSRLFH